MRGVMTRIIKAAYLVLLVCFGLAILYAVLFFVLLYVSCRFYGRCL